jgi:hypothetical protein
VDLDRLRAFARFVKANGACLEMAEWEELVGNSRDDAQAVLTSCVV